MIEVFLILSWCFLIVDGIFTIWGKQIPFPSPIQQGYFSLTNVPRYCTISLANYSIYIIGRSTIIIARISLSLKSILAIFFACFPPIKNFQVAIYRNLTLLVKLHVTSTDLLIPLMLMLIILWELTMTTVTYESINTRNNIISLLETYYKIIPITLFHALWLTIICLWICVDTSL